MRKLRGIAALVALALAAFAIAACGSSNDTKGGDGDGGGAGTHATTAQRAAGVPATIKVGAAIGFPPFEYYDTDGKTVIGFEPDIFDEVFKRIGTKPEWVNAKFETLFPGIESDRYDVLVNGIFDTPERQARFDFVDYLRDESGILVNQGNPKGITSAKTLCGTTIVVLRGTTHEKYVRDASAKCKAARKPAVNVLALADHSSGLLQMKAGRVDGIAAQFEQIHYWLRQSPELYAAAPFSYERQTLGAVFDKGNDQLVQATRNALQEMVADGTYAQRLAKWGLEDLALDEATVNLGR